MLSYGQLDIAGIHGHWISRTSYGKNTYRFSVSGGDHPHDPDGWTEWLESFATEEEAIDYIKRRRKEQILQELSELITNDDPQWLINMAMKGKLSK